MQKNKLKLNDSFKFNCLQCGSCCKNRSDILLTAYDLFRAAKHLDLPPHEFFTNYCETYIGDTSKTPVIRLKPKQVYNALLREPTLLETIKIIHKKQIKTYLVLTTLKKTKKPTGIIPQAPFFILVSTLMSHARLNNQLCNQKGRLVLLCLGVWGLYLYPTSKNSYL